jgi:conjugal transfer pilus assembly protein TraE
MEHGARQIPRALLRWVYLSGDVLTLSLTTNIIQGINNYRLQTEQKVAVTPMLFNAPLLFLRIRRTHPILNSWD